LRYLYFNCLARRFLVYYPTEQVWFWSVGGIIVSRLNKYGLPDRRSMVLAGKRKCGLPDGVRSVVWPVEGSMDYPLTDLKDVVCRDIWSQFALKLNRGFADFMEK